MAAKLYSDIQENIDALASRIEEASSFDSAQAANIALQLLGRKQLKIKSGALAQIFKSLDRDADTKGCRDELIAAGILEKLPGSGVDGKPAIYRIVADAELPADDGIEDVTPEVVEVEVERVETVEPVADDSEADVHVDRSASKAPVDSEPSATGEAKRGFVSMVGRGAAFGGRSKKKSSEVKEAAPQKAVASREDDVTAKPAQEKAAPEPPVGKKEPTGKKESVDKKEPKQQKQARKDSPRENTNEAKGAPAEKGKSPRKHKPAKNAKGNAGKKRRNQAARKPEPEKQESKHVPLSAVARVLGNRIAKASPVTKVLARVKHERKDIVKVDRTANQAEKPRKQGDGRSMRESIDLIVAWVGQHGGAEVPFASRRQRAYEILGDEKAFDGKGGERLLKKLNEKGITPLTLKMSPSRPSHFVGFYAIGSNKPFIVVENLDTYDEIVRLLKGKRNAKLFGIKVGGVIFGGGCKASVSHALDEYLSDIGYGFDYVYYAGDIDREGARIIEQTRAANVIQIKMHVGMYRAMIAEHKRRLKDGNAPEPAATMQGIPQNLATTIKDLPMVTRVQFRNILRDNQRVPQEILMSEAYRDASSDHFERMLNQ